ncbi:MAG: hypothetical protein JWL65_1373 [Gammaproteobacteria bacterium]|nr:hypothetical protein [Gammaproteobacteria bacterium]
MGQPDTCGLPRIQSHVLACGATHIQVAFAIDATRELRWPRHTERASTNDSVASTDRSYPVLARPSSNMSAAVSTLSICLRYSATDPRVYSRNAAACSNASCNPPNARLNCTSSLRLLPGSRAARKSAPSSSDHTANSIGRASPPQAESREVSRDDRGADRYRCAQRGLPVLRLRRRGVAAVR